MSYYWVSILAAFLPVTLLLATHWVVRRPYTLWPMLLLSLAALLGGIGLSYALPAQQSVTLGLGIARFVVLAGFVLWQLLALRWQFANWREPFWQVVLIFVAGAVWGKSPALAALSTVRVINTEFILNFSSVITSFGACLLLGWLLYLLLRQLPRWRWFILCGAGLMVLLPLGGSILLSLMKLEVLELTRLRLSFAAKSIYLASWATYGTLLLLVLLLLVAVWRLSRPQRRHWQGMSALIARRIALAAYRQTQFLLAGVLVIAACMASAQIYWDAVASQPPSLSAATRVQMGANKELRLTLGPLMDGSLHRFAWVADDGKVVRFFIINRLDDRVAPAVVMDACLLCGDKGYVQQGNQVVCTGCGVHLYKPNIGKPGGCNPVPIEHWRIDGDSIVIPQASLEAGLQLFATVLTIEVTDPVSGKKLTNTAAPYRYEYAGKTYFFDQETDFISFRDTPEKYLGAAASTEKLSAASAPTPAASQGGQP